MQNKNNLTGNADDSKPTRTVLHIIVGSADFEPKQEDLKVISKMFKEKCV